MKQLQGLAPAGRFRVKLNFKMIKNFYQEELCYCLFRASIFSLRQQSLALLTRFFSRTFISFMLGEYLPYITQSFIKTTCHFARTTHLNNRQVHQKMRSLYSQREERLNTDPSHQPPNSECRIKTSISPRDNNAFYD